MWLVGKLSMLSPVGEPGYRQWKDLRRLTENKMVICWQLSPWFLVIPSHLLTVTKHPFLCPNWRNYQMKQDSPWKKQIHFTDMFGYSKPQETAQIKCWLPGDNPTETMMILGSFPLNIMGLGLLKGKAWVDSKGKGWKFSSSFYKLLLHYHCLRYWM